MNTVTPRVRINGDVFRWARKELNLSYLDIAEKFNKSEQDIISWEEEKEQPTYRQLEKLSYSIFKIPLATFLLSEPPEGLSLKRNFRSLPDYYLDETSYKTRVALKEADFLQSALKQIYDQNPFEEPIFRIIRASITSDENDLSREIRDKLNINYSIQRNFQNGYEAFNYYREQIETNGVFIFQLGLEGDRAFCLNDAEFPLIVVNSSDSIYSRIFSLFHELTHLVINTNDIFRSLSDSFISNDITEIFCNKVASKVLVPDEELLKNEVLLKTDFTWNEEIIKIVAKDYSVSREVILRKLLDQGFATTIEYENLKNKWDEEFLKQDSGGGNYYRNKISSLGKNFIISVLENYSKGRVNDAQVSEFLRIKLSNLSNLEAKL